MIPPDLSTVSLQETRRRGGAQYFRFNWSPRPCIHAHTWAEGAPPSSTRRCSSRGALGMQ